MSDTLIGMAVMATLALWVRGRGFDRRLWPASRALILFSAALTVALILDATRWADWEVFILPMLPLALAHHLDALAAEMQWRRGDALFALSGILCLPYLLMPASALQAIEAGQMPDLDPRFLLMMLAGVGLFWALLMWATTLSGLRIWRTLRDYRTRLAQVIAQPPSPRLNGVALLGGFLACVFGLHLLDLLALGSLLGGQAGDLFLLALILGVALHGLSLREVWPDWADAAIRSPVDAADTAPSYARSGLDAAAITQLLGRLDAAMARESLWRIPGLTLSDLATAARAKPFYVSQALNQGRGESFFDYVNRARVCEAQHLLRDSDDTILDIAYAVGFNAKSTFNAAFRKHMGMTPSQWRRAEPVGRDATGGTG